MDRERIRIRDGRPVNLYLCYKNFGARQGISHIGLGVAAMNTAKVLYQGGINVQVRALKTEQDMRRITDNDSTTTHVVVSAPWVSTNEYSFECDQNNGVQYAVNCHSNVGFLTADTNGIQLIREQLQLEAGKSNFHVAGNSQRFCEFITDAYGEPCTYLPNLYYLDYTANKQRPSWSQRGGVINIGIFGAARWGKNFISSVAAGLVIAREMKAQVNIYINTNRVDGPETSRIMASVNAMVRNVPGVKLVAVPWCPWPQFRQIVGSMDLLLNPSYTESFQMVAADGCKMGVPSVVSDAIVWAPDTWKAEVDDTLDIAEKGMGLLTSVTAARKGLDALKAHNADGFIAWLNYLSGGVFGIGNQRWPNVGAPMRVSA